MFRLYNNLCFNKLCFILINKIDIPISFNYLDMAKSLQFKSWWQELVTELLKKIVEHRVHTPPCGLPVVAALNTQSYSMHK